MMNYIFGAMVLISVAFGTLTGRLPQVSAAAMTDAGNAVQLIISLAGIMCLWNGLLNIAQKAGMTRALSRMLGPVLRRLFRGLDPESAAAQAITMNISANILGLGNAATPLGLAAMKELDQMAGRCPVASNHMVTFVVLNTASIQLIPTTTAAIRLAAGSAAPMEILPAVWAVSLCTVVMGIGCCKLLERRVRRG